MKIRTRDTSLFIVVMMMLGLSACATTGNQTRQPTELANDVSYEVKPGDSLSDIALKLTGLESNWTQIATHNAITDPRTLAAGEHILIPSRLLEQVYAIESDTQEIVFQDNAPLTSATTSALPITISNGFSVARGRELDTDQAATVSVNPVQVNRSFDLQPLDNTDFNIAAAIGQDVQALQVKVIGSYYPKGIYAEPANYARLMSRVAPGTIFQLESQVNDWYKIKTDQGIGYLRQSDGALIR